MISQTGEHALRAVLYLARQPGHGPLPAERIAAALGAPANYLAKTLQALAKRGVVSSTRGPSGGFRLAVAPSALTVAEVTAGFQSAGSGRCLLGDRACTGRQPCAAHGRWQAMVALLEAEMRRTTIEDLLGSAAAPSVA